MLVLVHPNLKICEAMMLFSNNILSLPNLSLVLFECTLTIFTLTTPIVEPVHMSKVNARPWWGFLVIFC